MADIAKLRVMISSRSLTPVFGGVPLAEVRARLQARLHALRWQAPALPASSSRGPVVVGRDQPLFDVWIHENDPGRASDASTFEISLREINRADLVIALVTGEAGSAAHDSELGICHAELYEAITRRPGIVSLIALTPSRPSKLKRDLAFQQYVDGLSLFQLEADSEATLHARVMELLQERIARLAVRGGRGASRQRDRGQALDWNQLDLEARRRTMRAALREALAAASTFAGKAPADTGAAGAGWASEELQAMALPGGASVLARIDAIPAALTVAAARELVGQPFLRDHQHSATLEAAALPGIVHVIACHRGATETQALRMLGTPDAIAVASDFGIFVTDHVHKTQLVLLAQCGDATAIALALRRFSEWLRQSREASRVLDRAHSRRRILKALAAEQTGSPGGARRSKGRSA